MNAISVKLIKNPKAERDCFWCPGNMKDIPVVRVFQKLPPDGRVHVYYCHWECMLEYQPELKDRVKE